MIKEYRRALSCGHEYLWTRQSLAPLISLIALIFTIIPAFAWPTVYPTGTTFYDPWGAHPGYILFAPTGQPVDENQEKQPSIIYLINMQGTVVHRWQVPFFPLYTQLLRNGNLIVMGQTDKNTKNRPGFGKWWIGGAAGQIVELTWEGKQISIHEDLNMHHGFVRLPNGHYLYLAWEQVPKSLQAKVRGGIQGTEFSGGVMFNDYIVEVDAKGKVVWTWHANQHLDPDIDIIGPVYKRQEWSHLNSIDLTPDGNIIVSSRSLDSILLINKKTGAIGYRWGNTSYLDKKKNRIEYRSGSSTLGGPHAAQEIPAGLPGAGNLLCYDNGTYRYGSRAVEIDIATSRVVWQSTSPGLGRSHFSDIMGDVQRLPNGNTLICEGVNGRFFQITPQSQLVWEYISPYVPEKKFVGGVFRMRQYPLDWCPQFKKLPRAAGAPVMPPANSSFTIQSQKPPSEKRDSPPRREPESPLSPVIQIIALAATAALSFWLGRQSLRSRL